MIRSVVAPVSALIGFTVMLPQSLNQTSRWICGDSVVSMPVACSSSTSFFTRGVASPEGSPTIRPLPKWCRTTPGASSEQLQCTTPPITLAAGMARAIAPSGSTAPRRWPAMGPPKPPSRNHQGTPFIAVSTMVSAPISGAMRSATPASAGALTAITTRSCTPSSSGSATALTGTRVRTSPRISERPSRRSASSVAPRATTLRRWPACARPTPIHPPIAPAP